MPKQKRCARCNQEKPRTQFGADAGRKDGLTIYCKRCRRERYAEQRGEGKVVRDGVIVRTLPRSADCATCGEPFRPRHGKQRFCGHSCAAQDRARKLREGRAAGTIPMPPPRGRRPTQRRDCQQCGQAFDPWSERAKFCSRACKAEASLGDRKVGREGYVRVRVPKGTPGAYKNGWMLEHRYVMQTHLGRALRSDETVHHKDGNKEHNVVENLELWSSRHPKGQRVEDLVEFAREILSLYAEAA